MKLFEQQVVLAIRDLERVVDVIEFVMTSNLVPEFFDFTRDCFALIYPCFNFEQWSGGFTIFLNVAADRDLDAASL